MEYYEPPLVLGLDAAAIATCGAWPRYWPLRRSPTSPRGRSSPGALRQSLAVRPPTARCAITTGLALILAAFAGWPFLSAAVAAPLSQADTAGKASDTGSAALHHRDESRSVAAFPQIEEIGGFRPDPRHEHDEGLALGIVVSGDPISPEGVALGVEIRDFLLTRADELGIDHVLWRQHVYRADGASEPIEPRVGALANHVTHLHVTTKGGGFL